VTELLTSAQMRALEQAAIASGAVTGLELMERAGQGVVEAVLAEWPALGDGAHRAVVLCGPGNNGGDGFVVARLLNERGWEVEVFLHGDPDRLPPDARANHDRWRAMGSVRPLTPEAASEGDRPALLVDAMFGTGLSRPIPLDFARASHAVAARRTPGARPPRLHIVAVDCPSGLDCDTGGFLLPDAPDAEDPAWSDWWQGEAVPRMLRAQLTVTFHAAKVGHYLGNAPGSCGRIAIVDIGLREDRRAPIPVQPPGDRLRLIGPMSGDLARTGRVWPGVFLRPPGGHKFDRGHALVLAGGPGRGGAARLAARAALRVGAGLVTVGCPPAALAENAARLDAIMLRPFREITDLVEFLADGRISAVCLGPGLGTGEKAQQQVTAVLAAERATVLDADALTIHEDDPPSLFYQLHEACVLTPHEGEFARLFPDLGQRARGRVSKVEAVRRAAERAGCTVLLKGPDTVIASAGGAASLHAAAYDREAPWLATAGAGDVLAGMIAGLLARPTGPERVHPVCEVAAWLHVEAARSFGPGLIAEDLPEELPKVFRALGL
jgi:ADP-dependent NAD(P)H-hydrate dehydratase / NAD(P)H-hydrate epimerase